MSTRSDLQAQEAGAMRPVDKAFRYSGFAFFGLVTLIAMLSIALIVSQWDGVLRFLLGA